MMKLLDIEALLSDASSSQTMPQYGATLVMHLLNCSKNLNKVRQHVHHLFTNGIRCLESKWEEMVSLNFM